jgi:hypothetical protein
MPTVLVLQLGTYIGFIIFPSQNDDETKENRRMIYMKSRKERRQEAKANKVAFEPQYKGTTVKTYEEFHGVGYERFNNKFVTIRETEETLAKKESK